MVSDIDAKIKRAQTKLDTPIPENERPKEVQEKIERYDSDIKRMLQEVEKLGEEGKIEESEQMDAEIQNLKKKKDELLKMGDNTLYGLKQMKVYIFAFYIYISFFIFNIFPKIQKGLRNLWSHASY